MQNFALSARPLARAPVRDRGDQSSLRDRSARCQPGNRPERGRRRTPERYPPRLAPAARALSAPAGGPRAINAKTIAQRFPRRPAVARCEAAGPVRDLDALRSFRSPAAPRDRSALTRVPGGRLGRGLRRQPRCCRVVPHRKSCVCRVLHCLREDRCGTRRAASEQLLSFNSPRCPRGVESKSANRNSGRRSARVRQLLFACARRPSFLQKGQ